MGVLVSACLGRFGCSTLLHTHTRARAHVRSLALPHQAKARYGWHSMAWFGMPHICCLGDNTHLVTGRNHTRSATQTLSRADNNRS